MIIMNDIEHDNMLNNRSAEWTQYEENIIRMWGNRNSKLEI